ncbi:hypothetical protein L7750_14860 [Xenorhabdus bovienii]|uniref:hypothetical protein n=1 Tax=Xenorhabdus bovienii TaxID=40576 RepID=UPI001EE0D5F1|nr:hypothetical protein [Xenorhabdus bovienii]MCG3471630.1 hypothetical protein [Xenorhabdus bovienii]
MPRRQILTSEEKECLRIVPDDDILLTRMCFLESMKKCGAVAIKRQTEALE